MKVAWPTGELVADGLAEDTATVPGVPLPLDDAAIVAWAGSIEGGLASALAARGVTPSGLLAWARSAGKLPYPEEARLLLVRPDLCGLDDVVAAVDEAATYVETSVAWAGRSRPQGVSRLVIGGRPYLVEGRIGAGSHADVLRARWEAPLGELVVIKVAREASGGDALRREYDALTRLARSEAQGAPVFSRRVPPPIGLDSANDRVAAVYGWRSGFFVTLADAMAAHPAGIDGRVMVWVWKRSLELLGWAHRTGLAHGDPRAEHILVHPRDHGATLVGWTGATPLGEALPDGTIASPARDLAALAATIGATSPAFPAPIADLLAEQAAPAADADAWEVLQRLSAAGAAYGKPQHNPLVMPGW